MAAIRLTKDMRNQVVGDMMHHRFEGECKTLFLDQQSFADRVYKNIYSSAKRKQMQEMPRGWLPMTSSIKVQFGGQDGFVDLEFAGGTAYYQQFGSRIEDPDTINNLVPYKDLRNCVKSYGVKEPFSVEYNKLVNRRDDLHELMNQTRRQLHVALDAVTTVGALIKHWPECAPFVERFNTELPKLPALPVNELNQLLALPAEAAA